MESKVFCEIGLKRKRISKDEREVRGRKWLCERDPPLLEGESESSFTFPQINHVHKVVLGMILKKKIASLQQQNFIAQISIILLIKVNR